MSIQIKDNEVGGARSVHGRDVKENSLLQNLNWKTSKWESNIIILKLF